MVQGKNPLYSAVDRGSIPGWGAKRSHMPWGDGAIPPLKSLCCRLKYPNRMQQRSHPLQLITLTAKEKK